MSPPAKEAGRGSRLIRAGSLDPKTFREEGFGEVVQNPLIHRGGDGGIDGLGEGVSANQGTARKWADVTGMVDWYAGRCGSGREARCVLSLFVCQPRQLQVEERERQGGRKMVFEVKILERHPFTSQTFIPLGVSADDENARFLVVVAPTLPVTSGRERGSLQPPYPVQQPKRKRSLRERLLGARPSPYTNEHASTTTPAPSEGSKKISPKGPGQPDLDNIQAFIARGDQAVTYGPGTWHAPMVVLGEKLIEFVVVQYANGVAEEDCQEFDIVTEEGEESIAVDVSDFVAGLKAKL